MTEHARLNYILDRPITFADEPDAEPLGRAHYPAGNLFDLCHGHIHTRLSP